MRKEWGEGMTHAKAQSQACKDYIRFLDNRIMETRRKNSVRVTEKTRGVNSFMVYTVYKAIEQKKFTL